MTTAAPTLADYIGAHERLFAHYLDLCGRLGDEQMATRSLCPDWTVRDVITHAIGIEAMLAQWEPSVETPPPFERIGVYAAEVQGLGRADFTTRIAETIRARSSHLAGLDPSVVDVASITPVGVATYGRFLQVRVFDLWVHVRDIAIPLGEATDDSGFAAETALTEVEEALGYIVGKKIGLPEGMSMVFHVRGGVERDLAVVVDGRATRVDAVDSPDVEVTADVGTFVMLAAGRIDPQAQIEAGTITWTGADDWGDRAARSLAYTR